MPREHQGAAPDADGAVGAGGEQAPAVGEEGHRVDRARMTTQDAGGAAAAQVPHLDLSILAGGGEEAVVGGEGERGDAALMRLEGALQARGLARPARRQADRQTSRFLSLKLRVSLAESSRCMLRFCLAARSAASTEWTPYHIG